MLTTFYSYTFNNNFQLSTTSKLFLLTLNLRSTYSTQDDEDDLQFTHPSRMVLLLLCNDVLLGLHPQVYHCLPSSQPPWLSEDVVPWHHPTPSLWNIICFLIKKMMNAAAAAVTYASATAADGSISDLTPANSPRSSPECHLRFAPTTSK